MHVLELLTQATTIQPPAEESAPQPEGANNGETSIPTPVNRKISMIFPLVSCCSCVNNPNSS